jgi:hypothetical protein
MVSIHEAGKAEGKYFSRDFSPGISLEFPDTRAPRSCASEEASAAIVRKLHKVHCRA